MKSLYFISNEITSLFEKLNIKSQPPPNVSFLDLNNNIVVKLLYGGQLAEGGQLAPALNTKLLFILRKI